MLDVVAYAGGSTVIYQIETSFWHSGDEIGLAIWLRNTAIVEGRWTKAVRV